MKRQAIIIITFTLFFSVQLFSQSIRALRTDTYDSYVPKYGKVQRIVNTNTFYNKTGPEIKKEIIEFSINSDSIVEKRFKDNKLDAELFFVFNDQRRLVFRTYKQKIPYSNWLYDSTYYIYQGNNLETIESYGVKAQLSKITILSSDSLGNIITLSLYSSEKELLSYESAEYDYPNNEWTYRVFDNRGKKITERIYAISSKQKENRNYNENGDCVLYPRNWNEKDNTYYQVDYKYDKLGNWIKQTIYECQKINGELKNKKIDRKFVRKIKYIKN